MTGLSDALDQLRLEHERRVAEARAAIGDIGGGAILRDASAERWAFVVPDPAGGSAWRLQFFDLDGFSGHSVFRDGDDAIREAIAMGYRRRDDQALDALAQTHRFQRGNLYADLVQRVNGRELTMEGLHEALRRFDADFRGRENDAQAVKA